MSQIDDILFELERRVILFKSTTTLPDSSPLGYNGDPNSVVGGNTAGETLIYNCPVGTRYQQDDGTQWYKKETGNVWELFGGGGGGGGTVIEKTYAELAALISANEVVVGQKYLITDHRRRYLVNNNTEEVFGDLEPIIITGLTVNTFEPIVYSTIFSQDIIYYEFANNDASVGYGSDMGWIKRRIDFDKQIDIYFDWRQVKTYTVDGLVYFWNYTHPDARFSRNLTIKTIGLPNSILENGSKESQINIIASSNVSLINVVSNGLMGNVNGLMENVKFIGEFSKFTCTSIKNCSFEFTRSQYEATVLDISASTFDFTTDVYKTFYKDSTNKVWCKYIDQYGDTIIIDPLL